MLLLENRYLFVTGALSVASFMTSFAGAVLAKKILGEGIAPSASLPSPFLSVV